MALFFKACRRTILLLLAASRPASASTCTAAQHAPVAGGGQDVEGSVEDRPLGVVRRRHAKLVVLHDDVRLGVRRDRHQVALRFVQTSII